MKGVRRGPGIRLPDPESLGLWPKRAVHLALVIVDAAFTENQRDCLTSALGLN